MLKERSSWYRFTDNGTLVAAIIVKFTLTMTSTGRPT